MVKHRRRFKQTVTFEERLAQEAMKFREEAEKQPIGSLARELLLRRARQAIVFLRAFISFGFGLRAVFRSQDVGMFEIFFGVNVLGAFL